MTPPYSMTVIGFDVSLRSTGWAALNYDTGALVDVGLIETQPTDNITGRIAHIHETALDILHRFDSYDVALEEGIAHRSGTTTRVLAMAWAAVALAAWRACGIEPAVINIGTIKRTATGTGTADKRAMVGAAVARWGPDMFRSGDIADAAWTAETFRQQQQQENAER